MVHVEPEGEEADGVDDEGPGRCESLLEEERAGGGRNCRLFAEDFGKLHASPELDHVNNQEGEHHDTEHEHVLR